MNSLQIELDKINQQLEHLTFRKNQLEPIISEYNDVIERVKNLTENMIALNIEPTNLKYDLEDILEGNEAGERVSEADPFKTEENLEPPKPMDWADQWVETTEEAHSEPESEELELDDWDKVAPNVFWRDGVLKVIVPWVNVETSGEIDELCERIRQANLATSYEFEEYGGNWLIYFSVAGVETSFDSIIDLFFSEPDPTPQQQPIKMFAFVPVVPTLTPEPTPEPDPEECPKCEGEGMIEPPIEEDQTCPTCGGTGEKPEPQPEPVQINMQAYRRGDDVLIIGFTNKRLMNQWSKWFKSSWSDQVHISDHSDNLQGFNYCLTVLWFGHPHWERLTKLNYSLKPTEQNAIAYYQQVSQVANSKEE